MTAISEEALAIIQKEVEQKVEDQLGSEIKRYATIIGVVNLVVLSGIIAAIWNSANIAGAGIRDEVVSDIRSDIKEASEDLEATVRSATLFQGRLFEMELDLSEFRRRATSVLDQLASFEGSVEDVEAILSEDGNITEISDIIQLFRQSPDIKSVLTFADQAIETDHESGCSSPRVYSGLASAEKLNWLPYSAARNMTVKIDTSAAGFIYTPYYFVSVTGDGGHWSAHGADAIYSPKEDSFNLYLQWNNSAENRDIVTYANDANWTVNWLAIGC